MKVNVARKITNDATNQQSAISVDTHVERILSDIYKAAAEGFITVANVDCWVNHRGQICVMDDKNRSMVLNRLMNEGFTVRETVIEGRFYYGVSW